MAKRTYRVPVQPYWQASDDELLKALVANGGELYSALESVKGQVRKEKGGATGIWLRDSRVGDDGMEALAGLTEVKEFESSERMTDAALVHLSGMGKMERLMLNKMHITGDGLRHLAGMSRLTSLQIYGCTLTDAALSHLPVLLALTTFTLNSSTGCTDAALECLSRLENLEHFSLNGAPATGPGLRHLANLRRLGHLDLSGGLSRITTDDELAHLPELPTVQYLRLRYTYVTDSGLAHLVRLTGLKYLELEWTDVSDAGIRHLAALPQLESVNLNQTKVTLRAVRELQAAHPGIHVSALNCTGEPPQEPEPAALIRRPEYREAAPVAQSWKRIEAWFAEYLPAVLATLRPPASEADLDALEQRLGRPLPADFRASYHIHDGQNCHDEGTYGLGVLFGMPIGPINDGEGVLWLYEYRVEHEWPEKDNWMLDWTFYPPDAIREAWSGPGWVPFYWDVGRNFIGIDLDPGPNGVVGQVIPFGSDDEFRPVLALSFAHLLEDIADELEAGNAIVRPPEVSPCVFALNGGFRYQEWAEAKLPLAFQQTKAVPRFVPEDHATPVSDEQAAEVLGELRAFLTEMNEFERRWLAVRPLREYGLSSLQDCGPNNTRGWSELPRGPDDQPKNKVQEILWSDASSHDEKDEAVGMGKYWKEAVAQKRKIWRRFLTAGKRAYDRCFIQHDPPYYDPQAVVDTEVRQVAAGHVIVTYGQPRRPGTCGDTGRLRWYLRWERKRWRTERHECVDDPAKPWKLDLV